jgi:hypothetical protein
VERFNVSGFKNDYPGVMILQERYPRATKVEYTTLSLVYSYS